MRAAYYYREAVGYTLSATALKQLKAEGVPAEGVQALGSIEGAQMTRLSSPRDRVRRLLCFPSCRESIITISPLQN
jgi:hypothetical protein